MAEAAKGGPKAAAKLVEAVVFRGTYVTEDGSFGPGATIKVDEDELARLKRVGAVRPDDYVAPEEVQDGGLRVTAESGVNVIGMVA